MDVIVTSKTLQITQALKAAAIRQARKLVRFGHRIVRVRVSLEAVAKKHQSMQAAVVQYQVELPGKQVIVRRQARDMYEALVDAAASAARQIRKTKERRMMFKRGYRSAWKQVEDLAVLPLDAKSLSS